MINKIYQGVIGLIFTFGLVAVAWAAATTYEYKDATSSTFNIQLYSCIVTPIYCTAMVIQDSSGNEKFVTGNPGSITGVVTASESGVWNITNISGTVSLPTGAATSANQSTNAAQGSTTAAQTGSLVQGATTTGAPTYTTGQTDPLSLDTSGNLRVNCATGCSAGATSVVGTVLTNPASPGNWGIGATGVAVPTSAVYLGVNNGGNLTGWNGSVTASESGVWNITNISGAISLPTGASTSANQPTNAAQGSTTAAQTGNLVQGAVTTGSPTYTTGQTDPFSLDTAGNLRMNCVTGCSTSTGTTGVVGTGIAGTATTSALTIQGVLGMTPVLTNPASPGQWSIGATGAAVPTSATYIAINSAGTLTGWTGAVTNAGTFAVQAAQSGTWTVSQTVPASLTTEVFGAGFAGTANTSVVTIQGIATMVPLLTNPASITSWGLVASTQNGTTPTNGLLTMGQFNSTPTSITTGNVSPLQLDNSGDLRINCITGCTGSGGTASTFGSAFPATGTAIGISNGTSMSPILADTNGYVEVNVKTATGIAQASTTAAQTGSLVMGAVTTGNPTYTTAQTDPVSLDTAGGTRVAGEGTAGTATGGVVTVQGVASMTPVLVAGTGAAGTAATSVTTIQGIASMTPVLVAGTGAAGTAATSVTTIQGIASMTPVLVAGTGAAGTAATSVTTIQGIASMTPVLVTPSAPADACFSSTKTNFAISSATSGLLLVSSSAGKRVYVCSLSLVSAAATVVNFIEGLGTNCVTSPLAVMGSTTATSGMSLAVNGGLTLGAGAGTVVETATASNALCLTQTTSGPATLAGNLSYVQQ